MIRQLDEEIHEHLCQLAVVTTKNEKAIKTFELLKAVLIFGFQEATTYLIQLECKKED